MNTNDQTQDITPAPRKAGGARTGAGRPRGSLNKISGGAILDAIAQIDKPFEIGLAEDYKRARESSDRNLVQRYQQMILSRVVAQDAPVNITLTDSIANLSEDEVRAKLESYKQKLNNLNGNNSTDN